MIEETLGLAAQYGFPVVMCLLFYFDMRTLIVKLDQKINGHLQNHP